MARTVGIRTHSAPRSCRRRARGWHVRGVVGRRHLERLGDRAGFARPRADDPRTDRRPLPSVGRQRTGRHRSDLDSRRRVVRAHDAGSGREAVHSCRQRDLVRDLPSRGDLPVSGAPFRAPGRRARPPPAGARARAPHVPRDVSHTSLPCRFPPRASSRSSSSARSLRARSMSVPWRGRSAAIPGARSPRRSSGSSTE